LCCEIHRTLTFQGINDIDMIIFEPIQELIQNLDIGISNDEQHHYKSRYETFQDMLYSSIQHSSP